MRDIKELTGVRFLAAFYVFIFHIFSHGLLPNLTGPVGNIVTNGALGVNIFFVLSGFVLAYSHLKDFPDAQLPSWRYGIQFLIKRMARLYPAYLAGLVAYLFIWVLLHKLTLYQLVIAVLNALMVQSLYPAIAMEWYGGMSWSISVELFFYLLFPIVFPLLLRLRHTTLLIILAIVYVLSFVPGLIYNAYSSHFMLYLLAYTFPFLRLPEFLAGILVCILIQRFAWRVPEWVAAVAVILATLYLAFAGSFLKGYVAHNWIILPAIMLVIGALASAPATKLLAWLGSRPLVYLGKISYSFYVAQIPLMLLLDVWIPTHPVAINNAGYITGIFLLNLIGAYLLHNGLERPCHQLIASWLAKFKRSELT